MRNRFAVSIPALATVLVLSSVLHAQTAGQSGAAKRPAGTPPLDLSGVWEANMPGLPWATYSFSPGIPLMLPWRKRRYLSALPYYVPRAVDDFTDYVDPATGKDVGCLPAGVRRI